MLSLLNKVSLMKKILTLLSLIVSLSMVYPQTTDIYSIKAQLVQEFIYIN
ncbi:uncharacterized protein METZ01_LOCUS491973 [marine metagenome]|uniref:Uncharacterized protein n=1 Tax=marine metagenome TaxID=408172 RepID=A0A383D4B1_9ZZZZ